MFCDHTSCGSAATKEMIEKSPIPPFNKIGTYAYLCDKHAGELDEAWSKSEYEGNYDIWYSYLDDIGVANYPSTTLYWRIENL
jgi:hypothetical protein